MSVEIEGCVEILFRKLEVAQLRIPLTKSLRDECDGILIADRLGIRQGTFQSRWWSYGNGTCRF